MAVKTTGAEFKRFYGDESVWPKDTWHEDEFVLVNGEDWSDDRDYNTIPDDAVVKVSGGAVLGLNDGREEPSLEGYFKRWRKAQSTTSFTVECDKSKLDAIKAAVKAAGGRVA